MGINYRLTNLNLAHTGTTRLITVPTDPVTKIILSSGHTIMWLSNVGPSTLAWAGTGVTASSGNLLFYSMNQKLDNLAPDFYVFMIADSVAGTVAVTEGIA